MLARIDPLVAVISAALVFMLANVLPIVYVTHARGYVMIHETGKGLFTPQGERPWAFLAVYAAIVVGTFALMCVFVCKVGDAHERAAQEEEESPVVKFFREHPLAMCENCGDREYVKCEGCATHLR